MTARVISLKRARSKGYLTLTVGGEGESLALTVSEADYSAAGSPLTADLLTGEQLRALKSADEHYRATLTALRSLAASPKSRAALVRKLTACGISRPCADSVADSMVSLGYINETEQLLRLVTAESRTTLAGPRKIMAKLLSRGYSRSDIDSAIRTLTASGELDFDSTAALLIAKKLTRGATDEEKNKLLYKNGYETC